MIDYHVTVFAVADETYEAARTLNVKRQRLSWRFPIRQDSAVFIPNVTGLIEEDPLERDSLCAKPKWT